MLIVRNIRGSHLGDDYLYEKVKSMFKNRRASMEGTGGNMVDATHITHLNEPLTGITNSNLRKYIDQFNRILCHKNVILNEYL